MKLVVGLGNPGPKYEKTRHNVGFHVLSEVARKCGAGRPKTKFRGEFAEAFVGPQKTMLLCPHTYMNKSGSSVQLALSFYDLSEADLLVVCDDFNLPLAKLRFRAQGSAGGQKGLADIIRCQGTEQFARLRLGIGPPPANWDVADYVLSKFGKEETAEVELATRRAADAVFDWVRHGTEYCMNLYNGC